MSLEKPLAFEQNDEDYMREALKQAEIAYEQREVPVGAVIAHEGLIIARAHNQRELLDDPTAHAEMIALTQAASELGRWRLSGCTMYVTVEPCAMCAGALVLARIDRLVFGAPDSKAGACGSLYNIVQDERLNHRVQVTSGVLAEESGKLLQQFFCDRR